MPTTRPAIGRLVTTGDPARPLGTGFAVDERTVMTAFHCIGDRATGEVRQTETHLEWDGIRLPCIYLAGDPAADCAALRLEEPLPSTAGSLPLAGRVPDGMWRATGFPASLADLGAVTMSGTISNRDGQLRGVPAIQLFAEQSAAGLPLGGFSGAPVFVGDAPGVVGVIRYNPPDPESIERGIGGMVYACPVGALLALLDSVGIRPVLDTSHAESTDQAAGVAAASYAALPPDRQSFTGRSDEVDELVTALTRTDVAPVVAVHGQAGVGKSALAVHVAHLVAAEFPEGRLLIDLRGADQRPVSTPQALERLLLALRVAPQSIVSSEAARSAQYRGLLAGRRALIVLDNAHSPAQVTPLLPGSRGSAVLITSRRPMSSLETTAFIALGTLSTEEGVSLFVTVLGDDIRGKDRAGAAEVVELCDHLPLAIRIAAAQLRLRPHWSMADLVGRLTDERRRLSVLQVDNLAVRSSFDSSYVELPQRTAEAFAALGALRGADFPAWTLVALLGVDELDAEDMLDELVAAQLVTFSRRDIIGANRYRCHDLIRVYAAEKGLELFDEATRRASRERLFSGYLALLLAVASGPGMDLFVAESVPIVWSPSDKVTSAARAAGRIEWFTDERANLVAAARRAYEDGLWSYASGIIDVLNGLFVAQRHGEESLDLKDLAMKAAKAAGDPVAEAGALYSYASYYSTTGAHEKAISVLREAEAKYKSLGMTDRQTRALVSIGVVERDRGRLALAAQVNEECLNYFRGGPDELFFAAIQHNQSIILREQGRLAETGQTIAECLPVFRAHSDTGIGRVLHTRAVLNRYLGRFNEAGADLDEARPYLVIAGNVRWMAIVDLTKVRLLADAHRWTDVLAELPRCELLFRDSDDELGMAQVWRTRAAALRALGDVRGAQRLYGDAAAVYEPTSDDRTKARLTYGAALTELAGGDVQRALRGFLAAEEVFSEIDDPCWLLRVRHRLASISAASEGAAAAGPAWKVVRQQAEGLIERAGPDNFPDWLRPILADVPDGAT